MTLQASGTISLMQVNQELGRGAFSTISLNVFNAGGADVVQTGTGNVTINQCSPSRPNGSAPTSMNEWYSYNHNASCGEVYPCNQDSGINAVGGTGIKTFYENFGYLFTSFSQAQQAFQGGTLGTNYSANINVVYNSNGGAYYGDTVEVGNIIRTEYGDGRKECGYQIWVSNSYNPPIGGVYADFYVLVTDVRGKVIEKLGPYGKFTP